MLAGKCTRYWFLALVLFCVTAGGSFWKRITPSKAHHVTGSITIRPKENTPDRFVCEVRLTNGNPFAVHGTLVNARTWGMASGQLTEVEVTVHTRGGPHRLCELPMVEIDSGSRTCFTFTVGIPFEVDAMLRWNLQWVWQEKPAGMRQRTRWISENVPASSHLPGLRPLRGGSVTLNQTESLLFSSRSGQSDRDAGSEIVAAAEEFLTWNQTEAPLERWLNPGQDTALVLPGLSLQEWNCRCGGDEPLFEGQALSECLAGPDRVHDSENNFANLRAARENARDAVSQLGMCSIPWLLKWVQSGNPDHQRLGRRGFLLLNRDGLPALSALGELATTNSLALRNRAYSCIWAVSPERESAYGALLPALRHPEKAIRQEARQFLRERYEEAGGLVGGAAIDERRGHRRRTDQEPEQSTNSKFRWSEEPES